MEKEIFRCPRTAEVKYCEVEYCPDGKNFVCRNYFREISELEYIPYCIIADRCSNDIFQRSRAG